MPKFAANLTMLFTEVPFLHRFKAAADAGFTAVEFLFPYDYDKHRLVDTLQENELELVLHNLPAGNWAAGERGIACDPARIREFQDGVGLAVRYATTLSCPQLNASPAFRPKGLTMRRREAPLSRTSALQPTRWPAPASRCWWSR